MTSLFIDNITILRDSALNLVKLFIILFIQHQVI